MQCHFLWLAASSVPQPCVYRLLFTFCLTQAHNKSKYISGVMPQGGAGIGSDPEVALEEAFEAAEAACAQRGQRFAGSNCCLSPILQPLGRRLMY